MSKKPLLIVLAAAVLLTAGVMGAQAESLYLKYVRNWELGANWDEDEGPTYYLDPLIPVYMPEAEDRIIFLEPRSSFQDDEFLFNIGGGYRQLLDDREWMLGGNLFYDWETERNHFRVGYGIEVLSQYAELRANAYHGLSSVRQTENTSSSTVKEKAVDGFDVEVGVPVPYYHRLKVFGGYNWYDYEVFENRYGWTVRAEYKPYPFVVVDGLMSDDTKSNFDWGVTVALRWSGFDEPLDAPFHLDETMFPESDASEFLGVLVERHHDIVVEKERITSGVSVEVIRGT